MEDNVDDPIEAARKRHEQEARDYIASGMTDTDYQRLQKRARRFFSIVLRADTEFKRLLSERPTAVRRDLAIEAIAVAEREVPEVPHE